MISVQNSCTIESMAEVTCLHVTHVLVVHVDAVLQCKYIVSKC